jgi:cell wall-associated NlpC family hydrolase
MAAACSSTGAVPRPFPTPGGNPPRTAVPATPPETGGRVSANRPSETRPPDAYALTGTALSLRGIPYRNGGSDPNGFDCSGFTQYVFGQYGVALPRDVKEQYGTGKTVKPEAIAMGDLLFFTTVAPGASHVGIALGGDTFVHAPSSTGVVRVERLTSTYWSQRFVGARRIG